MGVNFGQKRGRMEPLNTTALIGYSIDRFRFEKFDHQIIADIANERLDAAEKRFREQV